MILKIIDKKYRCVIPKNERQAINLQIGDMLDVEIKRVIPKKI
jgi:AbrB family looped-hinge helix DNA binding protein